MFADQFNLTGDFPNGCVAFEGTCIFCDGDLCLARTDRTYRNREGAGSHIVDFVILPNFNTDGLKGKNFQGLCDSITAFDGLTVVGVGE